MARLLSRGTTGVDVSELQAGLNFHVRSPAKPLNPDGTFGPKTEARVREFQKLAALKPDALVGPNTIAAIYRQIRGVVDAKITPREAAVASSRSLAGAGIGGGTLFGQAAPIEPDVIRPQTRSSSSQGFDLENKLVFNPLAKPSEGDHPLQLTLSKAIPWPVFLPEPLTLDVDAGVGGKFELDGKIKIPFKLIKSERFELKPYFFVGGGVSPDAFKDVNAGAGTKIALTLFRDIGSTGTSLGLEADGGVKYKHDLEKNEGKAKGYLETTVVFTVPFNLF
jgi:hypothetical protein